MAPEFPRAFRAAWSPAVESLAPVQSTPVVASTRATFGLWQVQLSEALV